MRKLWFLLIAASAFVIAVPAATAGRPGKHLLRHPRSAPAVVGSVQGKGKGHAGGGGSGSYSIALIAPWGTAAYDGSKITVTYTLGASPGVPATARTAVGNAISSWNSCFGGGSGCGGITPKTRFMFTATSGSPLLTITIKKGGGVVAGSTKLSFDSSGLIDGARLQISAASFGSPNTTQTVYEIALHELGHVVGLGHSTDPNDLMYPVLNGVTSFGSCEVNGFNALYSSWLGSSSPKSPAQSSVSC
jgi:Matrixin